MLSPYLVSVEKRKRGSIDYLLLLPFYNHYSLDNIIIIYEIALYPI